MRLKQGIGSDRFSKTVEELMTIERFSWKKEIALNQYLNINDPRIQKDPTVHIFKRCGFRSVMI